MACKVRIEPKEADRRYMTHNLFRGEDKKVIPDPTDDRKTVAVV
jgi:hypothetical protein